MNSQDIDKSVDVIKQGGVVAYPTEAVFGLGCDPRNEQAVAQLLRIKQRPVSKGLIIISDQWDKFDDWIDYKPERVVDFEQAHPNTPCTWVIPASKTCPKWITGQHDSVAVRVTQHPVASRLCALLPFPLVSTSANLSGQEPFKRADVVKASLGSRVEWVVDGAVGGLSKPTEIRNAITGEVIREN